MNRAMKKFIQEKYGEVFKDWSSQQAKDFLKESGISERNWRVWMFRLGFADGATHTLRDIAAREGVCHVRIDQICVSTKKRFEKFTNGLMKN